MKVFFGCFLFLMLTGCQTLSDWWHGNPPPPVTAAEWNETEYKILVQQVATLNATEAQLQAKCRAYKAREFQRELTGGKYRGAIICPTVADDIERAKYLLRRQEKARQLLEQ